MTAPPTLNERAQHIADDMAANAAEFGVAVHETISGARILDCGIGAPGGLRTGLALARICLADQADVTLVPGEVAGLPGIQVAVATDHPVRACMTSQYAGWEVKVGKFFAMGSGPMRAAYGKEELFDRTGGREQAPVAVGVLEARKLPDEAVTRYLCERLNLPESKLTLLVAPTGSMAGTPQLCPPPLAT